MVFGFLLNKPIFLRVFSSFCRQNKYSAVIPESLQKELPFPQEFRVCCRKRSYAAQRCKYSQGNGSFCEISSFHIT
jgi:predicted nucleic acid binding AN1-type Zn finger protein